MVKRLSLIITIAIVLVSVGCTPAPPSTPKPAPTPAQKPLPQVSETETTPTRKPQREVYPEVTPRTQAEFPGVTPHPPVEEPKQLTKADLVDAVNRLREAMLSKIDSDVDSVAEAFADVKDYWKSKRLADILRAPLRILEDTLNLLAMASNVKSLGERVHETLSGAETVYEVLSVVLMLNGLQDVGEKLAYGLDGPKYASSVNKMLDSADATYVPPLDQNWERKYRNVIENHLYGTAEDTFIIIPRKSTAVGRKTVEFATGALEVRKEIDLVFDKLSADINDTELPEGFPLEKTITQMKNLRQEIIQSRSAQVENVTYETYLWDGSEFVRRNVNTSLGSVGSLYSFFGQVVARNLDKRLEIEMYIEGMKATSAIGSATLLYSGTYKVEGLAESIKVMQKALVLSEIIAEGSTNTFKVDAEKEYYLLPQEMALNLPIELSNLWMIANDTALYLQHLMGKSSGCRYYVLSGDGYLKNWQLENAIAEYTKAITKFPDCAKAYTQRGTTYGRQAVLQRSTGLFLKAKDDFDKAVQLAPDSAIAYAGRGYAFGRIGEYEQGIEDCNKAIELDPKCARAYNARGTIYSNKGRYDLAIADFSTTIELKPKSSISYGNRARSYYRKGEYDLAIADCNKAIELDPKFPGAHNSRGIVYMAQGDYELAIADFSKAIDLQPKNALAYHNRGLTYAKNGQYLLAISDFDMSIDISPNYDRAYYNRGYAYFKQGRKDKAIQDFERVVAISQNTELIEKAGRMIAKLQ